VQVKFKQREAQIVMAAVVGTIEYRGETGNGRQFRGITEFARRMEKSLIRRARLVFVNAVKTPNTDNDA
jgi:hypothetical protein